MAEAGPESDPLAKVETLLYCIGTQKAGTTWLHGELQKQGRIHFARKEFHYWDVKRSPFLDPRALPLGPLLPWLRKHRGGRLERLGRLHPRLREGALGWQMVLSAPDDHRAYTRALTLGSRGHRIVGDVTPSYALLGRRTFAEMAALHPDARFIFLMRDPVDRLWSGVKHRTRPWYSDPRGGVQAALNAFENAIDDPLNTDLRRSDYARTITELDAAVPAGKVLYLFYETLFRPETLARICAFIGIEPFDAAFNERTHEGVTYDRKPPEASFARAREMLAPTYDLVFQRFGDEVPEAWRKLS
jgi:hypothetical protein